MSLQNLLTRLLGSGGEFLLLLPVLDPYIKHLLLQKEHNDFKVTAVETISKNISQEDKLNVC